MEQAEKQAFIRKVLRVLFYATFILPALPTLLYFWGLSSGALPSDAEWSARGGNHGPWWGTGYDDFYHFAYLAMAALPYATFCYAVILSRGSKERKLPIFAKWAALAIVQFMIGFAVLMLTFWTVG